MEERINQRGLAERIAQNIESTGKDIELPGKHHSLPQWIHLGLAARWRCDSPFREDRRTNAVKGSPNIPDASAGNDEANERTQRGTNGLR
jgi:hypothetical protein